MPDDAPIYRLSNIKRESDNFGRSILVFDYELTGKGEPRFNKISIAGRTKSGELRGFTSLPKKESGQMRLGLGGMLIAESNFEVYLTVRGGYQKKYIVSSAIRTGNPGPATRARAWTPEEKEAAEKAKLY